MINNTLTILFTALLPIAVLLFYIYRKDNKSPEPVGLLAKTFFIGVLAVPLSLCISTPLEALGIYSLEPTTITGAVSVAFFGAAIPEEIAKFILLWWAVRKNRYFDEKMDGIVYAVCISLGFAALENIMYLFTNPDSFIEVGISRALFAVPGHFCFGILMGYYYSLAKFTPQAHHRNIVLALAAPIIVHGTYDAILFVVDVAPALCGILVILFLVFCYKMWKYCSNSIKKHLPEEKIDETTI